jgi:hypothetical protein
MSSSITSRVEATGRILLLAFACGCAGTPSTGRCSVDPKPPQPTPSPAADCQQLPVRASTPPPSAPSGPADQRIVKILAFDCIKAEDVQAGVQPADAIRISKWMAGGPGGASWNATDLLCFADIKTSCEQGHLSSTLRVGQRRVATQKTAITLSGPVHIRLSASERAWTTGFDVDKGERGRSFRTAVFSLLTEVSCTKPVEVAPGDAVFGQSADSSAFVAGFASGE